MSKSTKAFQAKWRAWRSALGELASISSAEFICPDERELCFHDDVKDGVNVTKVTLPYPICLYSIPEKQKSSESLFRGKTMAIFIDGEFGLNADNDAELHDISSSAAFYRILSDADSNKSLKLADAYHFDFFKEEVKKASPHPVFHTQRGIRLNDSVCRYKHALEKNSRTSKVDIPDITQDEKNQLFGFGSFRIPTPQMDILNLGAAIAGNQLVAANNTIQWGHFNKLLSSIHGPQNELHSTIMPNGHSAKLFEPPRKCLSDWYSNFTY